MTERTVTVQTETEETVTICDHCGLSDGGEMVKYGPENKGKYDEGYEAMDLHRNCLDEIGVEVPEGKTFADAVKETTGQREAPALVALTKGDLIVMSILGIVILGGVHLSMDLVYSVAATLFIMVVISGREQAERAIREIES